MFRMKKFLRIHPRLRLKNSQTPAHRRWVFFEPLILLAVLLFGATPSCEKKQTAQFAPARAYTVRGVIEQLPDPKKPGSYLQIHHEAIPDFVSNGQAVGMSEMSMPFPTAPGVSLDGFHIDDAVEFILEVQEKPRMDYRVTRMVKMAEGTAPNFKASVSPEPQPAPPAPR